MGMRQNLFPPFYSQLNLDASVKGLIYLFIYIFRAAPDAYTHTHTHTHTHTYFFFFFFFLGPHPCHSEVPRLGGVKLELQLLAYTTAQGKARSLPTVRGQGSKLRPHGY